VVAAAAGTPFYPVLARVKRALAALGDCVALDAGSVPGGGA